MRTLIIDPAPAKLQRERECVINLPGPELVEQVEALAPLTGSNPPAAHKADTFRYEPRKFQAAGLTPIAAETVKPPRWSPLLYVFRHYFSTGPELARSFRAED